MAEMKHFRPLLLAASLLTMPLPIIAQTDITAQYLTNPSFEADAAACTDGVKKSESADGLRGWDVSTITGWSTTRPDKQLLITADCFTDNNFGKTPMADGSYAVHSESEIHGVAPGQFCVVYDKEHHRCFGSGEIGF